MSTKAYRGSRGQLVTLTDELGAGGEGAVFSIRGQPGLCAKIYVPEKAQERAEKLKAMIAAQPSWLLADAIAWPTELLYRDEPRAPFAGFVMPTARGTVELYRLLVPDERLQIAAFLSVRDLCLLAAALARLVDGVHRAGHCVGDLKPQNVLVAPLSRQLSLVDTDSFQIRDRATGELHKSRVVTPEYTAPELFADPAHTPRTPSSDAFALAVLIHQLLLGGAHPFEGELVAGRGSIERIPERIRRGLCSLTPGVTAIRPAPGALSTSTLHPELRALFVQCFGPGHHDPKLRPDAATWRKALLVASKSMLRCTASSAHLYDRRLTRCPWCERRERTGLDLFPAGQGWQRAIVQNGEIEAAPERKRAQWLWRHARTRAERGPFTAADKLWLLKTGAALRLDRATITQTLDDAARPSQSAFERALSLFAKPARLARLTSRKHVIALSAASLVSVAALAASALMTETSPSNATHPQAQPRCASPLPAQLEGPMPTAPARPRPQRAKIGNTHGKGAYLRFTSSTASAKLPLAEGTVVRLTGQTRASPPFVWAEVEVEPSARTGWIVTKYLVPSD